MVTRLDLPGPRCKAWIERDRQNLSPSYSRAYPFVIDRGQGAKVWDLDGHRFLDRSSGIAVCATGHSHPAVVRAIQEQAPRFIHMSGADFYYALEIQLAEELNGLVPIQGPTRVLFTNSGTESVEAAFKLARYCSGRPRMLAFVGAFHGRSMGSLSLTASKPVQLKGFSPLVPGVTHVPYPYCYRCPFHLEYPHCDIHCVKYIEETVFSTFCPPHEVAAVFAEPIQGEGGYVVPPPGYLAGFASFATSTASCWWSMRCKADLDAPAGCLRSNTGAWSPISCPWLKALPPECPWGQRLPARA